MCDAPLIKQDPQANLTDVYAFVSTKYNDPSQTALSIMISVRPFSESGDGVIYDRFADDALYSIHITNPLTGQTVDRYDFQFSDVNPLSPPGLKNPSTILSYGLGTEIGSIKDVGDARQNYTQTYSVSKNGVSLGNNLPVAPPNVGVRTTPAYNDSITGKAVSGATQFNGVGVYASVSRPRITLRRTDADPVSSGPWIQVNRLANPLFNEVLVALRDKDNYNRTNPSGDSRFATYAQNPEIARLINLVFFGSTSGDSPIPTTGRSDLVAVYIPDVIRVDTTTPPVRLPGQSGFSRFGFVGGDTTTDSSGRIKSSGWPNGRRIGDDVVDIALTAVASGPTYSSITVVGDNVAANDQVYNQVFPYLATPHAGPTTSMRQYP